MHEIFDAYIPRYVKILNLCQQTNTWCVTFVGGIVGGCLYLCEQTRALPFGAAFTFTVSHSEGAGRVHSDPR